MTIVRRKGFILAHFAPFFGLPRKGLSPGLRGFFEPSTMKSSSSSRAPRGWRRRLESTLRCWAAGCKLASLSLHDFGVVVIHTFKDSSEQQQQQQYNLGRLRFNRRGASTPLWGVEACSPPSRRFNPIPAIPPYVVRTPHLHGAPTTEETVKL